MAITADLTARIVAFVRSEVPRAPEDIGPDTPLVTSGLLDSVALVRLAALIERETGVAVPDRDVSAEHFDTLRRIDAYVARRR